VTFDRLSPAAYRSLTFPPFSVPVNNPFLSVTLTGFWHKPFPYLILCHSSHFPRAVSTNFLDRDQLNVTEYTAQGSSISSSASTLFQSLLFLVVCPRALVILLFPSSSHLLFVYFLYLPSHPPPCHPLSLHLSVHPCISCNCVSFSGPPLLTPPRSLPPASPTILPFFRLFGFAL